VDCPECKAKDALIIALKSELQASQAAEAAAKREANDLRQKLLLHN
jgi:hypothetical protein